MRVHFVGVSGTGMGALASLFRGRGDDVTGSDVAFDPPVGPALAAAGVRAFVGYDAAHLDPAPDLVVVGNVIRRDNPEATAVRERGLPAVAMSEALREHFLGGRRPLVVTGTHGKTTTSAMCAWVLEAAGKEPGFFLGGIPKNFGVGAKEGRARTKRSLVASEGFAPFVVEGDEYDAVYWKKEPKFFDYIGVPGGREVVIATSLEHDHVDIYPDAASYEAVFEKLFERIAPDGLLVVDASSEPLVRLARRAARAEIVFYGLESDPAATVDRGAVTPTWLGAVAAMDGDGEGAKQTFDAFVGGSSLGRFAMSSPGAHNVRNAIATLAACSQGFGVTTVAARAGLATFEGVKRRQELLGTPAGIFVYDDFAHHPTAVDETLRALRRKHPRGALWAVFEPRSATACRKMHQGAYAAAFAAADHAIIAPIGRANLPPSERLDTEQLARDLGPKGEALPVAAIAARLTDPRLGAQAGDTVAILSNGSFGGLHAELLGLFEKRGTPR